MTRNSNVETHEYYDIVKARLAELGFQLTEREFRDLMASIRPEQQSLADQLETLLLKFPEPQPLLALGSLRLSSYERSHPNQPFYRSISRRRRKVPN